MFQSGAAFPANFARPTCIFIHMSAPMRPFLVSPLPQARGAQCPNCFTYNLLDHLPEAKKKRGATEYSWDIQCALCGSEFRFGDQASPAIAA